MSGRQPLDGSLTCCVQFFIVGSHVRVQSSVCWIGAHVIGRRVPSMVWCMGRYCQAAIWHARDGVVRDRRRFHRRSCYSRVRRRDGRPLVRLHGRCARRTPGQRTPNTTAPQEPHERTFWVSSRFQRPQTRDAWRPTQYVTRSLRPKVYICTGTLTGTWTQHLSKGVVF